MKKAAPRGEKKLPIADKVYPNISFAKMWIKFEDIIEEDKAAEEDNTVVSHQYVQSKKA